MFDLLTQSMVLSSIEMFVVWAPDDKEQSRPQTEEPIYDEPSGGDETIDSIDSLDDIVPNTSLDAEDLELFMRPLNVFALEQPAYEDSRIIRERKRDRYDRIEDDNVSLDGSDSFVEVNQSTLRGGGREGGLQSETSSSQSMGAPDGQSVYWNNRNPVDEETVVSGSSNSRDRDSNFNPDLSDDDGDRSSELSDDDDDRDVELSGDDRDTELSDDDRSSKIPIANRGTQTKRDNKMPINPPQRVQYEDNRNEEGDDYEFDPSEIDRIRKDLAQKAEDIAKQNRDLRNLDGRVGRNEDDLLNYGRRLARNENDLMDYGRRIGRAEDRVNLIPEMQYRLGMNERDVGNLSNRFYITENRLNDFNNIATGMDARMRISDNQLNRASQDISMLDRDALRDRLSFGNAINGIDNKIRIADNQLNRTSQDLYMLDRDVSRDRLKVMQDWQNIRSDTDKLGNRVDLQAEINRLRNEMEGRESQRERALLLDRIKDLEQTQRDALRGGMGVGRDLGRFDNGRVLDLENQISQLNRQLSSLQQANANTTNLQNELDKSKMLANAVRDVFGEQYQKRNEALSPTDARILQDLTNKINDLTSKVDRTSDNNRQLYNDRANYLRGSGVGVGQYNPEMNPSNLLGFNQGYGMGMTGVNPLQGYGMGGMQGMAGMNPFVGGQGQIAVPPNVATQGATTVAPIPTNTEQNALRDQLSEIAKQFQNMQKQLNDMQQQQNELIKPPFFGDALNANNLARGMQPNVLNNARGDDGAGNFANALSVDDVVGGLGGELTDKDIEGIQLSNEGSNIEMENIGNVDLDRGALDQRDVDFDDQRFDPRNIGNTRDGDLQFPLTEQELDRIETLRDIETLNQTERSLFVLLKQRLIEDKAVVVGEDNGLGLTIGGSKQRYSFASDNDFDIRYRTLDGKKRLSIVANNKQCLIDPLSAVRAAEEVLGTVDVLNIVQDNESIVHFEPKNNNYVLHSTPLLIENFYPADAPEEQQKKIKIIVKEDGTLEEIERDAGYPMEELEKLYISNVSVGSLLRTGEKAIVIPEKDMPETRRPERIRTERAISERMLAPENEKRVGRERRAGIPENERRFNRGVSAPETGRMPVRERREIGGVPRNVAVETERRAAPRRVERDLLDSIQFQDNADVLKIPDKENAFKIQTDRPDNLSFEVNVSYDTPTATRPTINIENIDFDEEQHENGEVSIPLRIGDSVVSFDADTGAILEGGDIEGVVGLDVPIDIKINDIPVGSTNGRDFFEYGKEQYRDLEEDFRDLANDQQQLKQAEERMNRAQAEAMAQKRLGAKKTKKSSKLKEAKSASRVKKVDKSELKKESHTKEEDLESLEKDKKELEKLEKELERLLKEESLAKNADIELKKMSKKEMKEEWRKPGLLKRISPSARKANKKYDLFYRGDDRSSGKSRVILNKENNQLLVKSKEEKDKRPISIGKLLVGNIAASNIKTIDFVRSHKVDDKKHTVFRMRLEPELKDKDGVVKISGFSSIRPVYLLCGDKALMLDNRDGKARVVADNLTISEARLWSRLCDGILFPPKEFDKIRVKFNGEEIVSLNKGFNLEKDEKEKESVNNFQKNPIVQDKIMPYLAKNSDFFSLKDSVAKTVGFRKNSAELVKKEGDNSTVVAFLMDDAKDRKIKLTNELFVDDGKRPSLNNLKNVVVFDDKNRTSYKLEFGKEVGNDLQTVKISDHVGGNVYLRTNNNLIVFDGEKAVPMPLNRSMREALTKSEIGYVDLRELKQQAGLNIKYGEKGDYIHVTDNGIATINNHVNEPVDVRQEVNIKQMLSDVRKPENKADKEERSSEEKETRSDEERVVVEEPQETHQRDKSDNEESLYDSDYSSLSEDELSSLEESTDKIQKRGSRKIVDIFHNSKYLGEASKPDSINKSKAESVSKTKDQQQNAKKTGGSLSI